MTKIHPTSDVQSSNIGEGTCVWQYSVILQGAIIGSNCNINFNVFIENDVIIGNNVTIKSGVQIWDGVTIEDDAFLGPNVTFTNDLVPRSKQYPESFERTVVKKGASIGANSTIVAGNTIGQYAFLGAGSVVTKSIPDFHVYYGNPAKHRGYITREGVLLDMHGKDKKGKQFDLEKL
ncbi:acyltransferase [Sphingobacterium paludis]|uniref:Acetyltransferase-like isoleucine patch superfamily enzyme n=1 Tax=Sphingobacterium paludis TaxID=1476465 RepID=A0A4R7CZA0_9SPHI|nr:acyltransferase [Sphingobacterium paludis]TDS13690.1 acetyltransferase-like isoleucine patch superfamily enzyme [Sphingobacterium paludis]